MTLERVEAAGQLGPEGLEPLVELSKGLGPQAVEPALGVAADLDEAGVAQHLEVPGHAGLVHADCVDELGHRTLAATHGLEDPATSRFGDRIEDGQLAGHRVSIRYQIYTCKRISPGEEAFRVVGQSYCEYVTGDARDTYCRIPGDETVATHAGFAEG